MPDHMIFHIVFLSQILLGSYFLPRLFLAHKKAIFKKYPPDEYPKLYPRPQAWYGKFHRNYLILSYGILLAGLVLLAVLVVTPRSGAWDQSIATWFYLLQVVPQIVLEIMWSKELKLMREINQDTTRKAELRPRRFSDYVSPKHLTILASVYLTFILFVFYIDQFDFPWFGGYLNVLIITVMNLFFASMILWRMYGKRKNPHESAQDRERSIAVVAKLLVFISIAVTITGTLSITISALDMRSINPIVHSLYLQALNVLVFRFYMHNYVDYDVYKAQPLATERRA
ncbi:MAG: hypothetical protein K0U72_15480 [Gammaproteobacteria bacterium]|nr:hypothetical protein [Gammaproteobacteria bacterium]